MKLIFHGGEKEVGRNCIELVTSNSRFLLDCGVKLGTETKYPEGLKSLNTFDAGITTHGHLDHCGAWPYMQSKGLKCPIFMTPLTREYAKILIKDFYKVESLSHIPPYKPENIQKAAELFKTKIYNQPFDVNGTSFRFFDAGHIPGSAYVLIETEGKRIVYTGDIKLDGTNLLKGSDTSVKNIDVLICESTYGDRDHEERRKTEIDFLLKIKQTLKRGGSVFIPSFSVGRTQELILLLDKERWDVPVYVDGMGTDITILTIDYNQCRDKSRLIRARNNVRFIKGGREREEAMKQQGIFVASAGMMTGGPIIIYLKEGHKDPKNSILLTGYVDTGTNGRLMLDEGMIFIEGRKTKVQAEYQQFDFSAHAGLRELREIIRKFNPRTLILVHGDPKAIEHLEELERKERRDVFVPQLGSEINI